MCCHFLNISWILIGYCLVWKKLTTLMKKVKTNKMKTCLKACLHGGGGPWVGEVTCLGGVTCLSIYSWLPITRTLANWNQNRFPLDFCHTVTVILPLVTITLDNSNLLLTRSTGSFCFPSDNFYTILPLITRAMLWTSHWRVVAYNLLDWRLMLFVTNLTWYSFTSENSKKHALFKQGFVTLCSDL